jgi:rhodanese-related sulfurtransferase
MADRPARRLFLATSNPPNSTRSWLIESPVLLDVRSPKNSMKLAASLAQSIFLSPICLPISTSCLQKISRSLSYCASGHRGAVALMGLRLMGYEKVVNLGGGLNAWKAGKFPVEGWVDWNATWGDFLGSAARFSTPLGPPILTKN